MRVFPVVVFLIFFETNHTAVQEESNKEGLWGGVNAVVVSTGKGDELPSTKSAALQTWLFKYELTGARLDGKFSTSCERHLT